MREVTDTSSRKRVPQRKIDRLQRGAVLLAGLLLCAGVLSPADRQMTTTGSEALDRLRFRSNGKVRIHREFTRSDVQDSSTPLQNLILKNRQTLIHYQIVRMDNAEGAIFYFVFRDEGDAREGFQRLERSKEHRLNYALRRFGQVVVLLYGYPTMFDELSKVIFEEIEKNFEANRRI